MNRLSLIIGNAWNGESFKEKLVLQGFYYNISYINNGDYAKVETYHNNVENTVKLNLIVWKCLEIFGIVNSSKESVFFKAALQDKPAVSRLRDFPQRYNLSYRGNTVKLNFIA